MIGQQRNVANLWFTLRFGYFFSDEMIHLNPLSDSASGVRSLLNVWSAFRLFGARRLWILMQH